MRILKITLIVTLLFLCACAGQEAKSDADKSAQKTQTTEQATDFDPPLGKKYSNIVFYDFETTPEIKTDYPKMTYECEASAISRLLMKKRYKKVERNNGSDYNASTLLVKTNIPDMRIVSMAARIWGGAFAGSSYMNMEVEFIDAASKKVVRKKTISSSNNAFAAAWTGGSNDQSLPADMGKILAEYIMATVPGI